MEGKGKGRSEDTPGLPLQNTTVKDITMLRNCGMCELWNQNGCGFNLCVAPSLKNRVSIILEVAEKDLEK